MNYSAKNFKIFIALIIISNLLNFIVYKTNKEDLTPKHSQKQEALQIRKVK